MHESSRLFADFPPKLTAQADHDGVMNPRLSAVAEKPVGADGGSLILDILSDYGAPTVS